MAVPVALSSARCSALPQRQIMTSRTQSISCTPLRVPHATRVQQRQTQLAALPYRTTTTVCMHTCATLSGKFVLFLSHEALHPQAPRRRRPEFPGFEDVDAAPLQRKDEWLLMDMGGDPYFNVPKPKPVDDEPKIVNGKPVQVNNDIKCAAGLFLAVD
jgi:hypothetical protein